MTSVVPARRSVPATLYAAVDSRAQLARDLEADDLRQPWIVVDGNVDLFAVRRDASGDDVSWTALGRLGRGAVFKLPADPFGAFHLVARRSENTDVRPLRQDTVRDLAVANVVDGEVTEASQLPIAEFSRTCRVLAAGIDQTLDILSRAGIVDLPPREFKPIPKSAATVDLNDGQVGRAIDGLCWATVLNGTVQRGGDPEDAPARSVGASFILTGSDWIRSHGASQVRTDSTMDLLNRGQLLTALDAHVAALPMMLEPSLVALESRERSRVLRQRELSKLAREQAEDGLRSIVRDSSAGARSSLAAIIGVDDDRALQVCRIVASRHRIELTRPPDRLGLDSYERRVDHILETSHVRQRTVRLTGDWWAREQEPYVGFLRHDQGPVAILPAAKGCVLVDPRSPAPRLIDRALATEIRAEARVLYRPLRTVGEASPLQVLRFGLSGRRDDVLRLTLSALIVGVLGLAVPVLTGRILGNWVPNNQSDLVAQGSILLILIAVAVAAVGVVQNISLLRLEGIADQRIQASIWDRLLTLPMQFFRQFSAAQLGTVTLGASAIREVISSMSTATLVSVVAGLLNMGLIFFYSTTLALTALAMVAISALAMWLGGRSVLRSQRKLYLAEQRLASRTFQFLSALNVLRLSAAEDRAFGRWSGDYGATLAHSLEVRRGQSRLTVFSAGYTVVCTAVIFGIAGGPLRGTLSLSDFLTAYTAFLVIMASLAQISGSIVALIAIKPLYEQVMPILNAAPEVSGGVTPPGELSGHLELRDVSLRYSADAPLVLDNVSLTVQPGEFVAIVGGTGSGKSSIIRVLLGLVTPVEGAVLYDGQDLRGLDVQAVRRQIGTVIQNGSLLSGDIASNIIGGSDRSIEDAWAAARLAGIADDIDQMPMKMFSVVSEGGSSLSGGQRQRLMIARALVNNPRIVVFDEATSALDNVTQRTITQNMHNLNATRIVVAHRLSTIENADRILVMGEGRIVQEGSYHDLVEDYNGAFARLVRNQLVSSTDMT